jgi:transportin-3
MLGGQEHELTMRTAELIEDNAQQALELLIRYATSSRMCFYALQGFIC